MIGAGASACESRCERSTPRASWTDYVSLVEEFPRVLRMMCTSWTGTYGALLVERNGVGAQRTGQGEDGGCLHLCCWEILGGMELGCEICIGVYELRY